MAKIKQVLPVLLASLVGAACYNGNDETGEFRGQQFNSINLNGISLNGISLNGISLNGISLNGISLNGISLNGISLNGISLNGISLNSTRFAGQQTVNGQIVAREGEDMIGSEWRIKVSGKNGQGQVVTEYFTIRIDDIYLDPLSEDGEEILLYDLSYKPDGGNEWGAVCKDSEGQAIPAMPLNSYWDEKTGDRIDAPNTITFACTHAVLAKCVEWGYRPWGEAWRCKANKWETPKDCDLESLKDYHQACTRMARADYCGTGTPWTVNGTTIDIYDHLYPQIQKQEAPSWAIEAEWGPDGAECLQDIRQQAWKAQGQYPNCPEKKRSKKKGDCGKLPNHRALLVSTFQKAL